MRKSFTQKERLSPRLSGTSLGMAAGLMALTLLGATGCDTVAQIAFPERRFQSIRPVSMNPTGSIVNLPGETCGEFNGQATLRMVLMANDSTPIKDGQDVSLTTVDLRGSDLSFAGGRIYSYPNVTCETGDCDAPLVCRETPNQELGNRCSNSTGISISGQPRFVGSEPDKQALAVIMSHEGRMRGWLPSDLGELFLVDENGVQIGGRDQSVNSGRAIDNTRDRFGALRQLRGDWQNLVTRVLEPEGREAYFGLWSFGESSAALTSWTAEVAQDDTAIWTRQPQRVSDAIDLFNSDPDAVRADVYQSVSTILDRAFGNSPVIADVEERTVVLIVGGHDERRRNAMNVDVVIEKARELGVRVFVVQVDSAMDAAVLRDDYRYYEEQTPCGSDDECKNFEECRTPQFLCSAQGSTCSGIDYPVQPGEYCLPKRDENGRVGPIHDYQRLGCETGGGFSYIPTLTNSLLYSRLNGMAMNTEAAWEVDLVVDEVGSLQSGEPHALEGTLSVSIGGSASYDFSTAGITGVSGRPDSRDTRPVFFTPAE